MVTADGVARVVNECLNPDLFWAIKGGGGGTFGVVTRFTLRTRELPEFFGAVSTAIRAASDDAYRALIGEAMSFYRAHLFNAYWGEKIYFRSDNTLDIGMLFQGLTRQQAEDAWAPFFGPAGPHPGYPAPAQQSPAHQSPPQQSPAYQSPAHQAPAGTVPVHPDFGNTAALTSTGATSTGATTGT